MILSVVEMNSGLMGINNINGLDRVGGDETVRLLDHDLVAFTQPFEKLEVGVTVPAQDGCSIFPRWSTHGLMSGAKGQRTSVGIGQDNQIDLIFGNKNSPFSLWLELLNHCEKANWVNLDKVSNQLGFNTKGLFKLYEKAYQQASTFL